MSLREDFFVLLGVDFGGFGKAFAIGEGFAVVDYGDAETGQIENLREALRDVAAAEDERARAAA